MEGPSGEVELSGVTFRWWKGKVRRKHKGVDLCHLAEFTLAQGAWSLPAALRISL